MQALDVENQVAAHRQAHPDGFAVAGGVQQVHVRVRHAVQSVWERAVGVLAAAVFVGRNRSFAGAGHIRSPDRKWFHALFHSLVA